jgi:peptide/nickel transport system permease protein
MPSFLLALLLVYLVAFKVRIFPVSGWERWSDGVGANLRHAFLPALSLSCIELAMFTQVLRADMINTLKEDFVLSARARGLPVSRILFRHALRPSSFSLVTLTGLSLGRLLSGAVVIEQLFGLPGLGQLIVQSIPSKDVPVVQGTVLFLAVVFLVLNLLVDLSYAVIDPRVRRGHA